MNKIITMCSKDYFQFGHGLLNTRHLIDAEFVCYGPDLNGPQIEILNSNDIEYKQVNQNTWDNRMQSLKFQFLSNEISGGDGGVTFVDWDTYFLKDWKHVFLDTFDLGITVRNENIKQNKTYRAWANGGVIFAHSSRNSFLLCELALDIIERGYSTALPEYDLIWKTLEEGRSPEKTHKRTNKRWWCDQILLSALVMSKTKMDYSIKTFDCKQYNNIWEETPDSYIMHLKEKSGAGGKFKDGR